jgi:hypothetical protein
LVETNLCIINLSKSFNANQVQGIKRINMNGSGDSLQMMLDNILNEVGGPGKEIAISKMDEDEKIHEITSKSANILLERLKLLNISKSEESKEIEREFEATVLRTWKKPLVLMDLLLYICLEVASEFNSEVRSEASSKHSYIHAALKRQQTNACLVFNEIIHLLKYGFPSRAFSNWRTLHEIACITYFISKHGEDMAKRYLDYEAVENFFQAQTIHEHQRELDCESLSERNFEAARKEFNRTRKKYGKDYVKKSSYPYGWVPRTVLKTLSLKEIEKVVKLDMLRPYYNLASYNVHGGPKGLMFKPMIARTKRKNVVLSVGPVNYGLSEPGKIAAISIGQTTACFLNAKPNVKKLVIVEAMRGLVDEICEAFCEIQADFSKLCTTGKKSGKQINP